MSSRLLPIGCSVQCDEISCVLDELSNCGWWMNPTIWRHYLPKSRFCFVIFSSQIVFNKTHLSFDNILFFFTFLCDTSGFSLWGRKQSFLFHLLALQLMYGKKMNEKKNQQWQTIHQNKEETVCFFLCLHFMLRYFLIIPTFTHIHTKCLSSLSSTGVVC
jgi:hypothetical protein